MLNGCGILNSWCRKNLMPDGAAAGVPAGAESCGGPDPARSIRQAGETLAEIRRILSQKFGGEHYRCPDSVCTVEPRSSEKKALQNAAHKLFRLAKEAKLSAIRSCLEPARRSGGEDRRKRTEDYRNDLTTVIRLLPLRE